MVAVIRKSTLFSSLLAMVALISGSCAYHGTLFREPAALAPVLDSPIAHSSYVLEMPDWRQETRLRSVLSAAPIRMAHVSLNSISARNLAIPDKVRPYRTAWAEPLQKDAIILRMNDILMHHSVSAQNVRVRMIAHAIVASGWRQNVWNYNAWGVRQGSWDGAWYEMPTYEEDDQGNWYEVPDASWRAFSSWHEAVTDFHTRISPDSDRGAYRDAYEFLMNPSNRPSVDAAYWQSLGDANYFTSTKFTPSHFAQLCHQIRTLLNRVEPPPVLRDRFPGRENTVACR